MSNKQRMIPRSINMFPVVVILVFCFGFFGEHCMASFVAVHHKRIGAISPLMYDITATRLFKVSPTICNMASRLPQSASIRHSSVGSTDEEEDMTHSHTSMISSLQQFKDTVAKSVPVLPALALCAVPETVLAFDVSPAWNSALLAYGHYFFLLLGTILLTYERATIAAAMSVDKEKSLVIADALYGVVGAFLAATGYFRVVSEYGKGWEYYSHEPLFWLKLSTAGLLAGLSLFPTITFVKRGSKLFQNEDIPPMSEELAARVRKVLNAEISAILSIPLFATLMARGVGYNEDFPWQLGAAFTVLTLIGSGTLYARQALTWEEPSPKQE
jgi:putative membrane protein